MAPELTKEWQNALRQVESRREMLHYKPAALLVMLDMLANKEATQGHIPFDNFERRFKALLRGFDAKGSSQAWEPFYHLSTGDQVWDLFKDGRPSGFPVGNRAKSRAYVLRYADEATIKASLLSYVSTEEGQSAIREAVLAMLRRDTSPKSNQLLASVTGTTPPDIHAVVDFEIGKIYDRRKDIHKKFGGQEQGGISTPSGMPLIFAFTGETGKQYGYEDEWQEGVFLYTGEGQVGDMTFVRGNRTIRDQTTHGKDLLLFKSLGKGQGYRYLGRFVCTS